MLNLHNQIIDIVGKRNFLLNEKEKTPYTTGWRTEAGECEFVVLPNSLLNMWYVLKLCIENSQSILHSKSYHTGSRMYMEPLKK